ncbi:MAG: ketopantoate reductase PanE/ApbA family protein, partial [Nocardioides sp.]|nr:ketopantoate reductase PanE/ApbA family protein [Nocardioides sp.]
ESLAKHYGDRFTPPQSLRRLVEAGHLGQKSGRGFSTY